MIPTASPSRIASHRSHHLRPATPRAVVIGGRSDHPTPLSRQLECPVCAPHEHHLLPCDTDGCSCHDAPVPGLTT